MSFKAKQAGRKQVRRTLEDLNRKSNSRPVSPALGSSLSSTTPTPFLNNTRKAGSSSNILNEPIGKMVKQKSVPIFDTPKQIQTNHQASVVSALEDESGKQVEKDTGPDTTTFFQRIMSGGETVTVTMGRFGKEAAEGLGLAQKDLKRVRMAFDVIDTNRDGSLSSIEFLTAMNEKASAFTDKVFQMIDVDRNGTIDFEEFIRMLATFCMFNDEDMKQFVFDSFNKKNKGKFDEQDFVEISKVVAAITLNGGPRKWSEVLETYDKEKKGYLNKDEFSVMEKDYPQFLHFARNFQQNMQVLTLGDKYFQKLFERQGKARELEEYKSKNQGQLPPENALYSWMKKVTPFGSDDYDVRTRDNQHLLALGRVMYQKELAMGQIYNEVKLDMTPDKSDP